MNHFAKWATVALSIILAACAGQAARQNVILPALAGTWSSIRLQVERQAGVTDDQAAIAAAGAATAALALGDPIAIATVNWNLLDEVALADVDRRVAAREIGPNVAESLRGRIHDFAAARRLYLRQP